MSVSISDKVIHLSRKYPFLTEELKKCLSDKSEFERLKSLVGQVKEKTAIIGERDYEIYVVAYLFKFGQRFVANYSFPELLDIYLGKSEVLYTLTDVRADIVLLRDTGNAVPNKQKENIINQVIEQNDHVIFWFRKGRKVAKNEIPQVLEFLEDEGAKIFYSDSLKSNDQKINIQDIGEDF